MNGDREARYRVAEDGLWRSLGVERHEQRVTLRGSGTTVRIQETGAGEPIVFLHGAMTSGTSWAGLVACLPDVHAFIVDRPGCGLSGPMPASVTDLPGLTAFAASFVPLLLDELGLDHAIIVSSSFGGCFAFRSAIAGPSRVRRVVELGWTVGARLGRMPLVMRLGTLPLAGALATRLPASERSVRSMFRSIGLRRAIETGVVSDEAVAAYAALINETDTMRNELALGRLLASPIRGMDRRLELTVAERRSLAVPVRLIWGEADSFGGIDSARAFAAPFADVRLDIVPGGGHSVWMEDARGSADLVRRSLSNAADPGARSETVGPGG